MEKGTVETQTNQQVLEQAPVAVEEKKPNILLIVILLIAILLVGIGGVYAGMQIGKKQVSPNEIISESKTPTQAVATAQPEPTTIFTPAENANWKIYTNDIYSIKVPLILEYDSRYPELGDFMHFSEINNANTTQKAGVDLEIGILKTPQGNVKCDSDEACYQQAYTSYSVGNQGKLQEISTSIDYKTRKGLQIISTGTPDAPSQFVTYIYPLSVNGEYLNIQFTIGNANLNEAQEKLPLVNQILSTFRFLE